MYKTKTFLSVVPARGGSKRLPGKNILELVDKPLIVWTIESAKQSKYIDKLIVSTDSRAIADIAIKSGAEIPFIRPEKLASDSATSFSVLKHSIDYCRKKLNKTFDFIVMLQPTAPLREGIDIDKAIEFLIKKRADSVVSVCEVEQHPMRSNILPKNLAMNDFLKPEAKDKIIQELPVYYRLNGAIHICRTDKFLEENTFFLKEKTFAFIMPKEKSFDIDTLLDFQMAELIMRKRIDDKKVE